MSGLKKGNIFEALKLAKNKEIFKVLARGRGFKIERIVSGGQSTPRGVWLCQRHNEWVMVVKGSARLIFKPDRLIKMKSGDFLYIPRNTYHRVSWTKPGISTVWLALHLKNRGVA